MKRIIDFCRLIKKIEENDGNWNGFRFTDSIHFTKTDIIFSGYESGLRKFEHNLDFEYTSFPSYEDLEKVKPSFEKAYKILEEAGLLTYSVTKEAE